MAVPRFVSFLLVGVLVVSSSSAPVEPGRNLRRIYYPERTGSNMFATRLAPVDCPHGGLQVAQRVECYTFRSPVDIRKVGGQTVEIAVQIVRARLRRGASIIVNPGGPGASGISFVNSRIRQWSRNSLSEDHDLVTFDPRGVGLSLPKLRCISDGDRDDARGVYLPSKPFQTQVEFNLRFISGCERSVGLELLKNIGTDAAVRDIEILRSLLGESKVFLFGLSYGSRMVSRYAHRFPENVLGVVLDGAISPEGDSEEDLVQQGAALQSVFDSFTDFCVAQLGCPIGVGGSYLERTEAFVDLVRPLIESPAITSFRRKLSYSDVILATTGALYSRDMWAELVKGLAELRGGAPADTLIRMADSMYGRDSSGRYLSNADVATAIQCVDNSSWPASVNGSQNDSWHQRSVAEFRSDGLQLADSALDVCRYWPRPFEEAVGGEDGKFRSLVIASRGDPATPFQGGLRIAEELGSYLIAVRGDRHTASFAGNSCVDASVSKFIDGDYGLASVVRC